MKFKSMLSGILAFVMLFSFMTIANAAVFPDVEARHSWAEEAIEDMVSRKILKGFPDGTFRPDNGITKLDALIIAARIAGVDLPANDEYADAANKAYKNTLEIYDINYKNEVAFLLYKGILAEDEVSGYIGDGVKANPLKRHEAAVLLTKMMGGVEEATKAVSYTVDYADMNDIPKASLPYVNYVNEAGVMKGMEDNMFMPYYEVSRAMMATMMYRAEKFLDEETYDLYVTSVSPTNGTIKGEIDGEAETIEVSEDVRLLLNGYPSTLGALVPGVTLKVTVRDDSICMIEGLSGSVQYTVSGTVKTTATTNGKKIITINPAGAKADELQNYPLADDCTIKIDKSSVAWSNIKTGLYVKLEVKAGEVTSVTAETKSTEYTGTIVKINIDETTTVKVQLKDGTIQDFVLASTAVVKRNGKEIDPWLLSEGDAVTLYVRAGEINTLTATSENKNSDGNIVAITISQNPTVTVALNGKETTYKINSETKFVVDGEDATIYDLRLGAKAEIKLESNTVAKISTSAVAATPVLVGTISYIHPTSYVMGIDVVNADGTVETVQAVVKSNVKITDTTSTKVTQFKNIKEGRNIVAVGTVNYGVYEVSQITITQ